MVSERWGIESVKLLTPSTLLQLTCEITSTDVSCFMNYYSLLKTIMKLQVILGRVIDASQLQIHMYMYICSL